MSNRARGLIATLSILALLSCGSGRAHADNQYETSVSVQLFYSDLAPYGRWVDHSIYGVVWVPASSEPGWHPYVYGRWVWTTDYGWYWDSDEEFGWATYHYGRWASTPEYGWVWVPDDVWGPAWVDWRYGEDQIGWAPMPPEYSWRGSAFVSASARIDLSAPRYQSSWVFVTEGDFARGEIRSRRLPASSNRKYIAASARVTNYAAIDGRVVNRSVDPGRVAAATKVKISPVRIAVTPSLDARAKLRAPGVVPVYRPRIVAKSKLDLELPEAQLDTTIDVDSRVRALENRGAQPPATVEPIDQIDRAAPPVFDRPIGGGIGLGGGLRIGR